MLHVISGALTVPGMDAVEVTAEMERHGDRHRGRFRWGGAHRFFVGDECWLTLGGRRYGVRVTGVEPHHVLFETIE
jgi:hypothetical protein